MDDQEHFLKDSKEERKERKRRSLKDRSQQKFTDQKQRQTQDELKHGEVLKENKLIEGRVLTITREYILIDYKGKKFQCTLRGALKKRAKTTKNLVAVGDVVYVDLKEKGLGMIELIAPRKSVLERAETLIHRQKQILASNVDQLFIVCSLSAPQLKPTLIDRYIISAKKGNIEPKILINKMDLLETLEEKALFEEILKIYTKENIDILCTSAKEQSGIDTLIEAMKNKTSLFSGQSGVGKTSLLNRLTHQSRKTKDTIRRTLKGAHTTTQALLLPLPFGGFCVDTPGVKSFALFDILPEDVRHYFDKTYALNKPCRFPNCTHTVEPNCTIKDAVDKGDLSLLRYENYKSLIKSLQKEHRRR